MSYFDWFISVLLVIFLLVAALYSKSKTKGVADFVVAGRKVRKWLGMSAMQASGTGIASIAVLGQEGFSRGFSYYWVTLVLGMFGVLLYGVYGFGIERFRATNVMTAAQYHEMRYSKGVRILAGIVMVVGGVLNMAVFPMIGANFLLYFLGLPETFLLLGMQITTVSFFVAILLILAVILTFLGGQVTVIFTDYIQSVVMAVGFFAILFVVIKDLGIQPIFEKVYESKGESAFNPLLAGSYGPTWIFWVLAATFLNPFSSGVILNRLATTANPKVSRQIILLSTIFMQGRVLMFLLFGVAAYLVLGNSGSSVLTGETYERVVLGIYFGKIAPPIIMGLMFAVFLFAEISTDDNYMLTWASISVNDVVCAIVKKPFSAKAHMWLIKGFVVLIAIFIFLWGAAYKPSESILNYLYITGTIGLGGGIAMLFGLYWKRASTVGAYAAILSCLIIPLVDMALRQIFTPDVYKIKHQHAGLLAIGLGVVLLVILSLASSKLTKFVDYSIKVKQSEKFD